MPDGRGRFVDEGSAGRMLLTGLLLAAALLRLAFGCGGDIPKHLVGPGADILAGVDSLSCVIVSAGGIMREASSSVLDSADVSEGCVDTVSNVPHGF